MNKIEIGEIMASLVLGKSLLPERLIEASLNQAELARKLGVSRQFIGKVIAGKRNFSFEMALNAAHILNCEPKDLHQIIYIKGSGLE